MFPLIILNLSAFSTDPQFIEVVPIYIANIYCKKKNKKKKQTSKSNDVTPPQRSYMQEMPQKKKQLKTKKICLNINIIKTSIK